MLTLTHAFKNPWGIQKWDEQRQQYVWDRRFLVQEGRAAAVRLKNAWLERSPEEYLLLRVKRVNN
jgi:hypothetical protein